MSNRIFLLLALLVIIDIYVFAGTKFLCRNLHPNTAKLIYFIFWSISTVCFSIILAANFFDWQSWSKAVRTYSFAFIFVTYFSKLFLVLFLMVDDVFRLMKWLASVIGIREAVADVPGLDAGSTGVSRSDFIVKAGVILAAVPFLALLFGMMKGKYNYQVRNINLSLKKLPKSFDGFKIVQISDLHTGSFMDKEPLEKAVQMILDLKPDVIFFTGDLVNDKYEEVVPYIETLSKLKAPHGVFSILGNHDYGDYYRWNSIHEKETNLYNLIGAHKKMGWDILLDEHRHLEKNGDRISVIGVQNWSAQKNFSNYGSLQKAVDGLDFSPVNILLSHDPSHWKAEVLGKMSPVDLTLSGHTHGFQFGVEIPGFKWSPVQYIYKEWADLYSQNDQHLYVNRGLGFIGYPGRVGILPEITLIELSSPVA